MAQGVRGPRLAPGSTRNSRVLLYNEYKYLKNRRRNDTVYWRCHRKECRVTLSTFGFDAEADDPPIRIKVEPARAHDHREDTTLINRDTFKSEAVRSVAADSGRQVSACYQTVLRNVQQGGGDLSAVPEFRTVRRTMHRKRAENSPPVPASLEALVIPPDYCETWDGDRFLSHQNRLGDSGFLLYATDTDYDKMEFCTDFYMDATYTCTPFPYQQYFTIHGNYRNQVILMASVLMTGLYNYILVRNVNCT